jgi:hypothetical protein
MVNELAKLFLPSPPTGHAGASLHRKLVSYELEIE